MPHAYRPIRKYSNIKNYQIDVPGDTFDTIIYNHNLRTEKRRRPNVRQRRTPLTNKHLKMVWGAAATPRNLARRAAFAGAGTLGAMGTRGIYNAIAPWFGGMSNWNRKRPRNDGWRTGYTRQSGWYGRGYTGGALKGDTSLNYCPPNMKKEHKFLDIPTFELTSGANVLAIDTTELCKVPVVGTNAQSERTGRIIEIRNIHIRLFVNISTQTVAAVAKQIRFMLILDTQTNGALPTANMSDETRPMATTDIAAFNNLENKGRFVVLWDVYDYLVPQSASGDGTTQDWGGFGKTYTFNKKCCIPIEYDNNASTGVIATIRSNNLIIVFGGSTVQVKFKVQYRMRFTD